MQGTITPTCKTNIVVTATTFTLFKANINCSHSVPLFRVKLLGNSDIHVVSFCYVIPEVVGSVTTTIEVRGATPTYPLPPHLYLHKHAALPQLTPILGTCTTAHACQCSQHPCILSEWQPNVTGAHCFVLYDTKMPCQKITGLALAFPSLFHLSSAVACQPGSISA